MVRNHLHLMFAEMMATHKMCLLHHLHYVTIIDFGLLSSPTPPTKQKQELQKLQAALSCWGCFQAINHGILSLLLDKVLQVAREFFELPMEQEKIISKRVKEFEGYGGDPVPEEGQSLDWSDRLFLDVYPQVRRKPGLWPENPSSFR
ncbi:protein SRG1-like isoform X2 [Abrus precatorius]|nr:protein SRG1-like isoform X2 [Abrus precatorius]